MMRVKSAVFAGLLSFGVLMGGQKEQSPHSLFKFPFFSWGFSIEGFPISANQLEQLEKETKIHADVIQFYLQWPVSPDKFTSVQPTLEAISNTGAVPCLSWEPMTVVDDIEIAIPYEKIVKGQYDTYLRQMAEDIKKRGKPLIICFAHEMNLEKYHWGSNPNQFNAEAPKRYIEMFRYVVNYFNSQNVHCVFWAFCPNAESIPNRPWNTPSQYYPGDEYVDILGMDGYNWDITEEIANKKNQSWVKPWASFEGIFQNLYQQLKNINPHKPILVFETSSVDRKGGQKSDWIEQAILTAKKWGICGILWFQVKKEEDWRIHQNDDYRYVPIVHNSRNSLYDWMQNHLK